MPPKPSSPTMTKTLSAFFTKADNTPTTHTPPATQAAEPAKEAAEPAETPVADSPKPKKRASRAKKSKEAITENGTPSSTTTTTVNNTPAKSTAAPKSPTKSRKATGTAAAASARKETLTAVIIPGIKPKKGASSAQQSATSDSTSVAADPAPKSKSSPSMNVAKTATSLDAAAAAEAGATLTPVPLGSSDATTTTAIEAPKSPSKPAAAPSSTNANGISAAATTTTGPNSGMSKVNKIDTASMFKVRSGKASFTENKLRFSAHPSAIADLCKFHEYRENLQEATDLSEFSGVKLEADCVEITSIPQEHYGLVAKMVEENDATLSEVALALKPTLCPVGFDAFAESATAPEDISSMDVDSAMEDTDANQSNSATPSKRTGTSVSVAAIMEVIQSVAQRVNYGVPVVNLPGQAYVTPPNLSVFRWEVQDIDQYFPSDMKAAVVRRRTKRLEASAALTAWFLGLDAKQQEDLAPPPVLPVVVPEALLGAEAGSLASGQKSRLSLGGTEGMDIDKDIVAGPLLESQPTVEAAVDPAVLELKLKEAESKKKEAEAKEERRLEKERKMAERQQEKDQKEAERLQKEEAKKKKAEEDKLKQDQRAQKFVGFFKNAAPVADKKDSALVVNGADCSTAPVASRFHPFHVKKNTALAPINRFVSEPRSDTIDKELGLEKTQQDSDKDTDMHNSDADMMDVDMEAVPSLDTATAKTTLSTLFSRTWRSVGSDASKPRTTKRLPQGARDMSVADVIQSGLLLQEDQDNDDMSSMLTWKDIPALRMRLFQFAENYRPAYYGTWSRRSKNITGRRFLGKDADLVDYDFDSEAEWEEDEEGEECKSDDDDDDADELCSEQEEEDDWLVPEGYLSDDEGLDAGDEGGSKEMSQKKSKDLRRPTLAHTAPVIVGPVFEMTLGEVSTYPALEAYHIEFLGDYGVGMEMYYAVEDKTSGLVPTLPTDVQV
ncbi:hypothetical protein EC957_007562 [Mortierella hygrophila]|uniref:Chromatin assembly factor 1 subunit A n=1 Tax=Mortierella hygrophila TaxID=979708 RepID=A0A9P6JYG9_9FUNG|nr:hypothetical protein EC957_007562 [Mortierella hygrophila]